MQLFSSRDTLCWSLVISTIMQDVDLNYFRNTRLTRLPCLGNVPAARLCSGHQLVLPDHQSELYPLTWPDRRNLKRLQTVIFRDPPLSIGCLLVINPITERFDCNRSLITSDLNCSNPRSSSSFLPSTINPRPHIHHHHPSTKI